MQLVCQRCNSVHVDHFYADFWSVFCKILSHGGFILFHFTCWWMHFASHKSVFGAKAHSIASLQFERLNALIFHVPTLKMICRCRCTLHTPQRMHTWLGSSYTNEKMTKNKSCICARRCTYIINLLYLHVSSSKSASKIFELYRFLFLFTIFEYQT